MKILVTGFEPFEGLAINPSAQLLDYLKTKSFPFTLETELLPVSFTHAFPTLKQKLNQFQPDFLIMTGLAQNRDEITFEKIAINFNNARNTDNDGHQPKRESVIQGGPDGLFTSLPMNEILHWAEQNKYPLKASYTAGTYVCNDLFYKALHHLNHHRTKAGFIHLPATEETKFNGPHMKKENIFHCIEQMLRHLHTTISNKRH